MKRITCLLILTLLVFGVSAKSKKAKPDVVVADMKTEMLINPMSVDVPNPRLGWRIISSKNNVRQTSYHIIVSSSSDALSRNEGDLWDVTVNSDQSQWVRYGGKELRSNMRCYWKVKINTTQGESDWSAVAMWNIGLLTESDWRGNWIGLDHAMPWDVETEHSRLSARYLRTEFKCDKQVKRATLYICGLGMYEAFINGRRIGTQVLAPAPTDYRKTVLYNAFDVTSLLAANNAIGVVLGNGRYYTMQQNKKPYKITNFGYPKLRLNLIVDYQDGTSKLVTSDENWKITADGPIRSNNEYDGELYDARKELKPWTVVGYDDTSWQKAERVAMPQGVLRGAMSENMAVVDTLYPASITRKGNHYIIDMQQNFAGWLKMKVHGGNVGDTIRLRYAETLTKDGELYRDNLRHADATDYYILRGDENGREWSPCFVYHGFRYAEVTGLENAKKDDFIGEVISDKMDKTGKFLFVSPDPILADVYHNAEWGVLSDYKGMPVDCPQRDERQPWLGDRARGCFGESYLFDNHNLYAKWVRDICEAQREDGCIPDVAPAFWNYYSDNVTWPSALPFSLEMLYRQYGDLTPIEKYYPNVKRWLEHLKYQYEKDGLMPRDKYGDWCVPPEKPEMIHSQDPARITDGTLIGTAYYYKLNKLMEKFAGLQGLAVDAAQFAAEAGKVKDAFNKRFLTVKPNTTAVPGHLLYPDSTYYGNNTVTANLLPIVFGMTPDEYTKQEASKNIIRNILTLNGEHISCGVIGVQWLMQGLTDMGRGDIAWRLATQKSYPSWGYMAMKGATTTWELWNGDTASPQMNSGNHIMLLGDLVTWIYEDVAGIRPDADVPGFKHIIMKPDFSVDEMDNIISTYRSIYGDIISKWRKESGVLSWRVEIPANTSATLCFPDGTHKDIGSGTYDFSMKMPMPDARVVCDEFLYKQASFPECHASTIAETKDGSLVAAYFGGTKERNPDVCIWVSRKAKGSHQWTNPLKVADGVFSDTLRKACWNPVLYQVPGGELLLFFKIGKDVADWTGWMVSSKDGGKTWSRRKQLPDGILGPVKNKPILHNGRLISPCSMEKGGWRLYFEYSDDMGKTWKKTADVEADSGVLAIQPTILVLPDGRLEALCRTRSRFVGVTYSSDNGATWSRLQLTDVPNNNSGIDAVNISDHEYALVYNNWPIEPDKQKGARTPLSVSKSNDGIHWSHWMTLEGSPISQYSYPSIIKGKDGRLHIVYTWRRQRIKYVEIK
jgi:alpha-L-rhamnosidase